MLHCVLINSQNFFSTEFVGQEQGAGGLMKVIVSSDAWLFGAISVPLTLATLAVWWLWVKFQDYQGSVLMRLSKALSCWRRPRTIVERAEKRSPCLGVEGRHWSV